MLELARLGGFINWQYDQTLLLDRLATLPPAYTAAARTLLRSLESCGANYDALVRDREIEMADWQADLEAHRAQWEAALEPLYTMAQLGWRANGLATPFYSPENPSGIVLPFSLDELPVERAGAFLLDADGNPSVSVVATEPGVWGNQVRVMRQGNTLYASFGDGEELSADAPIPDELFGEWKFGDFEEPLVWPTHIGIGAIIFKPAWHPYATQLPADDSIWKPLTGGHGLCFGRLLGHARKIVDLGGAFEPPARALCSQIFRVPVKLSRYDITLPYLQPVPVGLPENDFGTPGTFSTVWEAHERLVSCLADTQNLLYALASAP
jgi:hypothetical protein